MLIAAKKEAFAMKTKCDYKLKPETIGLLKSAGLMMTVLYGVSVLLYYAAGTVLDFQLALIWSEQLVTGLRAGFGLLCLGLLAMEIR